MGSVTLRDCGGGWCGQIARPLDPQRPRGRQIEIFFRWFAAAALEPGPTLVAVEGGPGYPSTGSKWEYRGIYGPLRQQRNLLLVDNRGTGRSALIDCKSVQSFTGRTSGSAFARRAARCAREIDARYGRGASGLFATAYAVDDMAAVIRALKLDEVDLYGDSYGGWFAQDFVARHPRLIHSLVLDSTYPRRDLDPWYASSGAAARAAMEIVSPGSVARLGELLTRVRRAPITGRTRDVDGSRLDVRVDPRALVDLVQDAASDPVIARELDASVTAALGSDDVPLLRLAGQANTWNHTPSEANYFSRGQYLAVACADYPQLSDQDTPPEAFAPFTAAEWLTISGFSQPYDVCANWPAPIRRPPPVPNRKLPASVPVLIVGGDLDSLTPFADAPEYAPDVGANVKFVKLRNTVHVTSEGDTYLVEGMRCARRVIRSFLRDAFSATCADTIVRLHTAEYPRTLADATPATLVSGPDPGVTARRAATVAAHTFADAIIRSYYSGSSSGSGPGLRGGEFKFKDEAFSFEGVRFVADHTTDGTGTFHYSTGGVNASLTVAGVNVVVSWTQRTPLATATIGSSVLSLPAP